MSIAALDDETLRDAVRLRGEHPTTAAAARAAGIHINTFKSRLERAAKRGIAPGHTTSGTAPGFGLKYLKVHRDADGVVKQTWECQTPDEGYLLEALRAAVEGMAGEIAPVSATVKPDLTLANLLTLYTFTDFHLGALCWHKEGGDDWDVAIAEDTGRKAMAALVGGSPASHAAIVNIQGDFLHYDGLQAITPTHGHVLDADSRFGRVVEVAIRLIRALVATALSKHDHVTLLIAEGNHDIASSLWLRKLFAALYEDEPRVTVHESEIPYYAIQWGRVMLGFHHGHMRKNEQLPALFAAQYRKMWGECHKVAIHTGHRHHREVKEHPGAEVIQHPTIAARDAHASRGGWFSDRRIQAITYHRDHGEVGSNTVTPEMIQ